MLETRGRKSKEAYVDGEYYIVKKPVALGHGVAVIIPRDWLDVACMGRPLRYFLLNINSTAEIRLRPYFDNLPAGQEEGDGND